MFSFSHDAFQVDGHDLRYATHDEAVEVIRQAKNPVRFVVKNTGKDVTSLIAETPATEKTINLQEVNTLIINIFCI